MRESSLTHWHPHPDFPVDHPTQYPFYAVPGRLATHMPVKLPHSMRDLAADLLNPDGAGARMIVRGFVDYRDHAGARRRLLFCYYFVQNNWGGCNPNNATLEYDAALGEYVMDVAPGIPPPPPNPPPPPPP